MVSTLITPPLLLCPPKKEEHIGNKAGGLCLCAKLGINVPRWFVIPAEAASAQRWRTDALFRGELLTLAMQLHVRDQGLVVRSSTELEDSDQSAHAGEFLTEKIVLLEDLIPSIERIVSQRPQRPKECVSTAVIIQTYVVGTISGVAFSVRPTEGTTDEYYCEFIEGGCEKLVNGSISPQNFYIDVRTGKLRSGNNGVVPGEVFMLSGVLADWISKLEAETGKLYDIEWVYDGVTLWCVQARPMTRLKLHMRYLPPFCATSWFYDERFRAPITPITRSTLMRLVFKAALDDPLRMSGAKGSANDVFYYAGRPFVRHRLYRSMFAGIPRFLLTPYLRQLFPTQCSCENSKNTISKTLFSLIYRVSSLVRNVTEWLCNRRIWNQFKRDLHDQLPALGILPEPTRTAWVEHWKLLEHWSERFLLIHRWSILLAEYSNAAFELCLKLLPYRFAFSLRREFAAGLMLPTSVANKELVAFAQNEGTSRAAFLEVFGHRSESLDFFHPRWAEELAQAHSKGSLPFLNSLRRKTPDEPERRLRIPIASEYIEMREEQRFEWERILAYQRSMLLQMGNRLETEGSIEAASDIWFLQWAELQAILTVGKYSVTQQDIRYRKHEYRVEGAVSTPQMIPERSDDGNHPIGNVLRGSGASAGNAHGSVLVVQDSQSAYTSAGSNTVLVMRSMSPSETPVLLGIAALVLETGGLLSHAAIMAREYGIPLVTAASHATEILRTGMFARVNGDIGTVEFGWRCQDGE